jgi:hypothetical protein
VRPVRWYSWWARRRSWPTGNGDPHRSAVDDLRLAALDHGQRNHVKGIAIDVYVVVQHGNVNDRGRVEHEDLVVVASHRRMIAPHGKGRKQRDDQDHVEQYARHGAFPPVALA